MFWYNNTTRKISKALKLKVQSIVSTRKGIVGMTKLEPTTTLSSTTINNMSLQSKQVKPLTVEKGKARQSKATAFLIATITLTTTTITRQLKLRSDFLHQP